MSTKQTVTIYGAGMSGLVAAINLVREGYDVVVHDREKGYGGDSLYNPSTHTTPIYPEEMSDYIGIDITPVFHPLSSCYLYVDGTRLDMSVIGSYTVERGNRPTSLDTLLYRIAMDEGVAFEFGSPFRESDLEKLPPNTIIACGLTPKVYAMLQIPYLGWEGWISRGECGFSSHSWIMMNEDITEYGYLSACNNYYFNLLFSIRPVSTQALERYQRFMVQNEGLEHDEWHYAKGCVPIARPDNPRLFHRGLIMCGTMSGFMDPFGWFGIVGALTSGKIAALAISDPPRAREEFAHFNRYFRRAFFFKNRIWYPFIRPHTGLIGKGLQLIGPQRLHDKSDASRQKMLRAKGHIPYAIPGFGIMGSF